MNVRPVWVFGFTLYAIGFVLHMLGYGTPYWCKGSNYVFGLFEKYTHAKNVLVHIPGWQMAVIIICSAGATILLVGGFFSIIGVALKKPLWTRFGGIFISAAALLNIMDGIVFLNVVEGAEMSYGLSIYLFFVGGELCIVGGIFQTVGAKKTEEVQAQRLVPNPFPTD